MEKQDSDASLVRSGWTQSLNPLNCSNSVHAFASAYGTFPFADSELVVMTTEILRNIMYRQEDSSETSQQEDRLATVGLIVLDEVTSTL